MPAEILATSTLRDGWIRVLSVRMRLKAGVEVDREVEDHGRGVAVLPYDPTRRVALLVHLPRAAVLLADGQEELLEAPAGYVEEADPDDAARRELYEETGLRPSRVHHVGRVWLSPGISTERLDLYLAPYSAGDRVGAGGGVESENENITVMEVSLAELWSLVQANRMTDMKTLTLILMLHKQEPQLFAAHGSANQASSEK
jgi:nudix-type nucleoside diphosphatase (YffH/AdpP family)